MDQPDRLLPHEGQDDIDHQDTPSSMKEELPRLVRKHRLVQPKPGLVDAARATLPSAKAIPESRVARNGSTTRMSGLFVLGGMILAIVGQLILVTRWEVVHLPPSLSETLRPMWPHVGPAIVALSLFVVASTCFAIGTVRLFPEARLGRLSVRLSGRLDLRPGTVRLAVPGLILFLAVLYRLALTTYDPSVSGWFIMSAALILGASLWQERTRLLGLRTRIVLREHIWEALYLSATLILFIGLNWFDLRSWYFAAIGDEYAFYDASKLAAAGTQIVDVFSQRGVYGTHPVLSTFVRGVMMRVLGVNVVGWKLSLVLLVAPVLPLTYILARSLYNRRTAVLALGMLATSHYVYAFIHTGYNNIEPIAPTVGSFLFLYLGLRHRSPTALLVSGIFAGLGWYTFFSGRATIVILAVVVILTIRPDSWLAASGPVAAGFALLILPLAAVNKTELVSEMFKQAGAGSSETVANRVLLPYWNLGRSLLAFNYNTHDGRYVLGSLAEPLTALLFVLGLGYAVGNMRDYRARFLLSWFGIGLLVTGVVSPYDYVAVSRLHYLMPVVALLAALAVDRALVVARAQLSAPRWRRILLRAGDANLAQSRLAIVLIAVVITFVTYGNLHRWFIEAPATLQSTQDELAIRIVESPTCQTASRPPLVVDAGVPPAMRGALDARPGQVVKPEYVEYSMPTTWVDTATFRCVIFRDPSNPRAAEVERAVGTRWPGARAVEVRDLSGQRIERVIYPTGG